MKRILFALALTLTSAAPAFAAPTTQELINCARNHVSVLPEMAQLKVIGQSLDLIEKGAPAQKAFLVLFTAESQGGTAQEGSIDMVVGRNVDEEATSCTWQKDGATLRASLFNFQLK